MAEDPTVCETGINSIARLEVSRRDLVKLRDLIDYLEASIRILEIGQSDLEERLSETAKESARLKSLFNALFGDEISGIDWTNVREETLEERPRIVHAPPHAPTPEQITLGIGEVTREQMLSVMDAIKKVSEESGGHAPKDVVLSRSEDIGITRKEFGEILTRLRRAGALVEKDGTLKLV